MKSLSNVARIKLIGFAAIAALMFAGCAITGTNTVETGKMAVAKTEIRSYKVAINTSNIPKTDDEYRKMDNSDIADLTDRIKKEVGDELAYDEKNADITVNMDIKKVQKQTYWRGTAQASKALFMYAGVADIPTVDSDITVTDRENTTIYAFKSKAVSGWRTLPRLTFSGFGFETGMTGEAYTITARNVAKELLKLKDTSSTVASK